MTSETNKTKFFYQLKIYGIKNFIFSLDFIISIVILIFLLLDKIFNLNTYSVGNNNFVIAFFAASSTLFAITLTALAIILSFSSSKFMQFLREHNQTSKLLFLFWLGSATHLVVIILSIIYLIINVDKFGDVAQYIYILLITFFTYGVINAFYLLATVMRFGYFLDVFDRITNGHDKKDKIDLIY